MKNAQSLLLLLVIAQAFLLFLEALAGWVMLRRFSFVKTTFVDVLKDCWRLRHHVAQKRACITKFRRRSDFGMLRYFRLRLNRWFEISRILKFGFPKST